MSERSPWRRWVGLFEDTDGPRTPHFDPVHLAVVLVATQVVIGALYWLLWTLFVYEGGLPAKVGPFLSVVIRARSLRDYGWLGTPDHQGIFEGWLANLVALLLCGLIVALLFKADGKAAKRSQ
jgi:hypothetical protein